MTAANAPVVRASHEEGGSLVRLMLDRPRGNVIDLEMTTAMRAQVASAAREPALKTILIEGAGASFSFGASIEEHELPAVRTMLPAFHELFRELAGCGKVLLAAVRGKCLGGGLELVAFCHRVFAAPDANLGNPEIKLGVFAPLASAVLPLRIGQAAADDLLLTGRSVDAGEAKAIGLVDEVHADPAAAAVAWHRTHLSACSASSLAHAVRAARHGFHRELLATLSALERQYLDELMGTADANEGIAAFRAKRAPSWRNA